MYAYSQSGINIGEVEVVEHILCLELWILVWDKSIFWHRTSLEVKKKWKQAKTFYKSFISYV